MNSITSSTRRAAFEVISPTAATRVHRFLQSSDRPLGASEIATALKMELNTARSRLSTLQTLKMVEVAAKRSKKNGLPEATWRAVQSFDGQQILIPGMA